MPSTVGLLVVVTQADVVSGCRIYQSIVISQLTAGGTVVTYQPFDGAAHVYLPQPGPVRPPTPLNVLARPRTRRDACRINQLFTRPDVTLDTIRTAAALRQDPRGPLLNAATLRDEVARHPEWGYDATLEPDELVQAVSLNQVRLEAEMVTGPSSITRGH